MQINKLCDFNLFKWQSLKKLVIVMIFHPVNYRKRIIVTPNNPMIYGY